MVFHYLLLFLLIASAAVVIFAYTNKVGVFSETTTPEVATSQTEPTQAPTQTETPSVQDQGGVQWYVFLIVGVVTIAPVVALLLIWGQKRKKNDQKGDLAGGPVENQEGGQADEPVGDQKVEQDEEPEIEPRLVNYVRRLEEEYSGGGKDALEEAMRVGTLEEERRFAKKFPTLRAFTAANYNSLIAEIEQMKNRPTDPEILTPLASGKIGERIQRLVEMAARGDQEELRAEVDRLTAQPEEAGDMRE